MPDPKIIEEQPMTVAFIRMTGPYDQIPQTFGKLYAYVTHNGWTPAGPPRGVYLTPPDAPGDARWELWAPIAPGQAEQRDADALGLGVLQIDTPRTMASVLHIGSYDSLPKTYEELGMWIGTHGYEVTGPSEEIYYSDPDEVPPEQYQTDIMFPVRKT